jgi:hypothetical protein
MVFVVYRVASLKNCIAQRAEKAAVVKDLNSDNFSSQNQAWR